MMNVAIEQSKTKLRFKPWIVCFSAALFFFYEFIQINMFNAISPGVTKTFGLSATQLGNLAATYLYSTVLFLFPIGLLLDRFSTRKLILIAMSICICCTALFASSHNLVLAQIFRFIGGGAGAFCFLSSLMLASRWFPSRKLALVTGLIVTMAMVGGVVAQTPLTLLVDHFGWRYALLASAGLGVLFWLTIFLFVTDYPENYSGKTHQQYELGFWISIKQAVKNYQTWFCGLYTCLLNLLILVLGAVYGDGYLQTVHHLSRLQASYVTTMIFAGTIIGSPLWGWYSDKIGRRKKPMILGAILSLLLVLFVIFNHHFSPTALIIVFFILGITTAAQIISYPLIVECNSRELTGASEGIASALIMAGGAIFQPFFGWLMDLNWNGALHNGIRVYTQQNYQTAMWILPVAFFISLLLALSVRETYCGLKR